MEYLILIIGVVCIVFFFMWFNEIKDTERLRKQLNDCLSQGQSKENADRYEYLFINVKVIRDNVELNQLVKEYEDDGYVYSYDDTLDESGILAFRKLK